MCACECVYEREGGITKGGMLSQHSFMAIKETTAFLNMTERSSEKVCALLTSLLLLLLTYFGRRYGDKDGLKKSPKVNHYLVQS